MRIQYTTHRNHGLLALERILLPGRVEVVHFMELIVGQHPIERIPPLWFSFSFQWKGPGAGLLGPSQYAESTA